MYEIHKLTGSQLVDAAGRPTGPESAGVVSRHDAREEAERELEALNRLGNGIDAGKYQIREAGR